ERKQGGRVFADNDMEPTVALVAHKCGLVFLFGFENNPNFNQYLPELLFHQLDTAPSPHSLIFPEVWGTALAGLIGHQADSFKLLDLSFHRDIFESNNRRWKAHIPEGFEVWRMDTAITAAFQGIYIPAMVFDSVADFLSTGFGFALLTPDKKVASICYAGPNLSNQVEVAVETAQEYRGRGFAGFAGAAVMEYCIEHGLEPFWCCDSANTGSRKLALKLGFQEKTEYPIYCWMSEPQTSPFQINT
ncbi:MAG TPA: GNAT family N-acetyltransferase, partial [Bacillota bacterium]|nr:GNAT family N-acetyltransferase [Bacillota bacterium]